MMKVIYDRAAGLGLAFDLELHEAARPRQRYEFLGIAYDHSAQSVTLAESNRAKVKAVAAELQTNFDMIGDIRAIELFGVLFFAYTVLVPKVRRSALYWILKNIRRVGSRIQRTQKLPAHALWNSLRQDWNHLATTLALDSAVRVVHQMPDAEPYELYTDASLTGWGAIIISPTGKVSAIAGSWPSWLREQNPSINELEMTALEFAVDVLDLPRGAQLRIFVDNTSVQHGLRKAILREFWMARSLDMLARHLDRKLVSIGSVEYIESERNPADWFSRLSVPSGRSANTN